MMTIFDARGTEHPIPVQAERIISLVPSTTETLFELNCGSRVVGATRFCLYPTEPLRLLTRVGGTKSIEWDRVQAQKNKAQKNEKCWSVVQKQLLGENQENRKPQK